MKTILITGGSRGIGKSVVNYALSKNYRVISVPGYFDWGNWYFGAEYIQYDNYGINLRYKTGEKESLIYTNGLYLIIGYKYGSNKKKRRRR